MNLAPTLAELAADPTRAAVLPPEAAAALLSQLAGIVEALRLRVTTSADRPAEVIDADELGRMLDRSRRWVEQHLNELPPRRSLLGSPAWLRSDVEKWIRNLPRYGKENGR